MNFQEALQASAENPEKVFWFKHPDHDKLNKEGGIFILITNKQFVFYKDKISKLKIYCFALGGTMFTSDYWHEDNTKKLPEYLLGV